MEAILQSWCEGLLLRWPLLLWSVGSRAQAQEVQHSDWAALRHAGSSQMRDQISVPDMAGWILSPWTTREAQCPLFKVGTENIAYWISKQRML